MHCTLCVNLYHYDCFLISKDLMESENKIEIEIEKLLPRLILIIVLIIFSGTKL